MLFRREDGFVDEMRLLLDEIAFQEQLTLIHKCLDNTLKFNYIQKSDCPRTDLSNVIQSVRNINSLIKTFYFFTSNYN
jgi:hypothetical protein